MHSTIPLAPGILTRITSLLSILNIEINYDYFIELFKASICNKIDFLPFHYYSVETCAKILIDSINNSTISIEDYKYNIPSSSNKNYKYYNFE